MLEKSQFFLGTFGIFGFWFLLSLFTVKFDLKRKDNKEKPLDYRIKRSNVFEDVLRHFCLFLISLLFLVYFLSEEGGSFKNYLVLFLVFALIPLLYTAQKRKRD